VLVTVGAMTLGALPKGLLFIKTHDFGAFNASGTSAGGAISAAAAIALFCSAAAPC
jgi:hypothetical protein